MAFLTGIKIKKEIKKENILIESLDNSFPFVLNRQVTEDSIDLRLNPYAIIYKKTVNKIDYLQDNLSDLFEEVELSRDKGFTLKPNEVLFAQTLEAITFPDYYVGLVVTRNTFAGLGISVTCNAPKFAAGISWAFPLQITNHNNKPFVIYPYAVVAQLMISTTSGVPIGYQGKFQNYYKVQSPKINQRERTFLQIMCKDSENRTKHILKKEIEDGEQEIMKKANKFEKQKVTEIKKRNLKIKITLTLVGVLGALCMAVLGNLLSGGELTYWKKFSAILLAIIGMCLTLVPIVYYRSKD